MVHPEVQQLANKADQFQQGHTDQAGRELRPEDGVMLDKQDFAEALQRGKDAVSNAAGAVKDTVAGTPQGATGQQTADTTDAAYHASTLKPAEERVPGEAPGQERSVKDQVVAAAQSVRDYLSPTVHAVEPSDKWEAAKEKARHGTQDYEDAARLTAEALGDKMHKTKDQAACKLDETEDESRRFLERGKDAVTPDDDAQRKARELSDKASDHAREAGRQTHAAAVDATEGAKRGTEHAADSAAETLQAAKDRTVNALKQVGSRFTAPISGDEQTDREAAERLKRATVDPAHKGESAADAASRKSGEAKDTAYYKKEEAKQSAHETKEDLSQRAEQTKEDLSKHASQTKEDLSKRAEEAKDDIVSMAHETADAVQAKIEQAKEKAREVFNADLEPHTPEEAALAEGYIPSNTEELKRERGEVGLTESSKLREHTEGKNISAQDALEKSELAFGEENLGMPADDLREAAHGAGPHAKYS